MQLKTAAPKKALSKILLVDDEPCVLRSLRAVLKSHYKVLVANDAKQAQALMTEHKDIVVIVSDERMPEKCGHELLIWVKENFPFCTRILMSGNFDVNSLQSSINDAEAFYYLTKPWDNNKLRTALKDAVLSNRASIKLSLLKRQSSKEHKTCSIIVLNNKQEKKHLYQKLADSENFKIIFFDRYNDLIKELEHNSDIGILFVDTNFGYDISVEVVSEVNTIYPDIVVIIVTTAAEGGEAVTMLNEGQIFRYLIKPLTITRLKPMLLASVDKYNRKRTEKQVIISHMENNEDEGSLNFWNKISSLWNVK